MGMRHTIKIELPKLKLWKKKADAAVEDGIEVDMKDKTINISGTAIIGAAMLVGVGIGYQLGKSRGIKKDSNVFIVK